MSSFSWETIAKDFLSAQIAVIQDPQQIQKLSLDYYHFSPLLSYQLADKRGDLVVCPQSEAEVVFIAQYCAKNRIPLTLRGAGTGNYGQCIPLAGGIIVDFSQMNQILALNPGKAQVEPGIKMVTLDQQAHILGWELRMAPSTYQTATLGGFLGGGSVGMGSLNYGMISDRGNVPALRIVTVEEEPRVLDLIGDETQSVLHAYGTNGIITALEVALAPRYPWLELIVCFPYFAEAIAFAQALAHSSGIVKKQIAVHADPIPTYFTALQDYLLPQNHCVMVILSEYDLFAFQELVKEYAGQITLQKNASYRGLSLLEFNWNHTTLLARSQDPDLTYLQVFYGDLEKVQHCHDYFGDEVMIHLEFLRFQGRVMPAGLPLVKFTQAERLQEIIDYHNQLGATVANPHAYTIEEGGGGVINPAQLALKQAVDPYGLLNPGKMRSWSINGV